MLFSIITPTFNSEKTIERTLNSVLQQDFQDYEYIIVDGGSKDNTINIIRSYEAKFKNKLKWKSELDRGIYDAFNKGIAQSVGEFIWIVNSDDYIEPFSLSTLAAKINSLDDRNIIIAGKMNYRNVKGCVVQVLHSSSKQAAMCYNTNGMGIPHPATIVHKSIYNMYGCYDSAFKICGDMDWFFRIYKKRVNILFVDFLLTNMTEGGVSTQFLYWKNAKDRWRLLSKRYSNKLFVAYYVLRWSFHYLKYKS